MSQEHFIMAAITAATAASVFYIPRKSRRLALVSFLSFQTVSWPVPLILNQIGYTEFPVREFPRATAIGFTSLYLFIPGVFAWFMLLYPQRAPLLRKIVHYFVFISIGSWFTYYIATYTGLEVFLKGTTLFNILFLYARHIVFFVACHVFLKWFSKKTDVLAGGLNA